MQYLTREWVPKITGRVLHTAAKHEMVKLIVDGALGREIIAVAHKDLAINECVEVVEDPT